MMKKTLLVAVSALMALSAQAKQPAGGLQYTYLQGQWSEVDFDGNDSNLANNDIDLDGLTAAASFKLNESFYLTGDHMRLSESGYRVERLALAGGFRMPLSRVLDINVGAGLVDYDVKNLANDDDSGIMMYARVRGLIEPDWEISAGFQYEDALIEDTAFTFSAGYHFHRQLSVGIATSNGDMDVTSLYLRFAF